MASTGVLDGYEGEAEFGKIATIIGFVWTAAVLAAGAALVLFREAFVGGLL